MRPGEDDWLDVELLEVGRQDDGDPAPGRRARWPRLAFGIGFVVLAVVAVQGVSRSTPAAAPPAASSTSAGPTAPSTPSASSGASPSSTADAAASPDVTASGGTAGSAAAADVSRVVTSQGPPLAGLPDGFDLFGLSKGQVVHLQPGRGRVTVTTIPGLVSIVTSLVATPSAVVLRTYDSGGTGHVVPDGSPARAAVGALAGSGPMLEGPDPDHVWVAQDGSPGLTLVGVDGSATGTRLALPEEVPVGSVSPDGSGGVVATGVSGAYDVRRDGTRRITSGSLLAVGAAAFLTVECDERHACANALVSRTGARRSLPGAALLTFAGLGQISPDGRTAAVFPNGGNGIPSLALVDLSTGALRTVALDNPHPGYDAIAWTPDGRRLFALDASARLHVVDVRAATSSLVDPTLPEIYQLTTRTRVP